jgi:hypothetical protein
MDVDDGLSLHPRPLPLALHPPPVLNCAPELLDMPALVQWLNASRDVYTFLKLVRRGFSELAKARR